MVLLNKDQIQQQLAAYNPVNCFNVHLFTEIDSTNRYLKDLAPGTLLEVCCAEMQTQGKGRFGRSWYSPFGENIYCSIRWHFNNQIARLSGLSLVISLAILAMLQELNIPDIALKWPNDILWTHKKLCGSLIEIVAESNDRINVIIGIGLNVNTDTASHPLPDKLWCSLYEITGRQYDRNELVAKLLIYLERYLDLFLHHDLNFFREKWNRFDYLSGKNIKVAHGSNTLAGIACGINQSGQLIVREESGTIHYLSAGDTSLHEEE